MINEKDFTEAFDKAKVDDVKGLHWNTALGDIWGLNDDGSKTWVMKNGVRMDGFKFTDEKEQRIEELERENATLKMEAIQMEAEILNLRWDLDIAYYS